MIPDKCPKCGASDNRSSIEPWGIVYKCRAYLADESNPKTLQESAECIRRQRDELAERVKRLEEAGDFMELCLTHNEPFRSDAKAKWHKAKESKP